MIKCPNCGGELEANFNEYQDKDSDYVEVEFICVSGHTYFVRIREDDLVED